MALAAVIGASASPLFFLLFFALLLLARTHGTKALSAGARTHDHKRIDCTANSAVSLVIPTLTKPAFGGHIVHPIGHDLAELLILEVVDVHAPWGAFRTIIGSTILEVADELLRRR